MKNHFERVSVNFVLKFCAPLNENYRLLPSNGLIQKGRAYYRYFRIVTEDSQWCKDNLATSPTVVEFTEKTPDTHLVKNNS